ncbi:hypothetical protein BDV95DRAFT_591242 [Massariosphaeria phaeospora]|uniref:Enoyl reductase (ER) domain-containing protein n=1 Tax=Massariosphaeria phaeospora TaxID=100035 RepID=A0A7C8IFC7_9PLEO|nr:hypothetical protein BDV95DRAFT_591242 [Massariosphaeria phaeospora]
MDASGKLHPCKPDSQQQQIAVDIKASLASHGFDVCSTIAPEAVHDLAGPPTPLISLLEIEGPFLSRRSESEYVVLKRMIELSPTIICVTVGGGENTAQPETNMIAGFGKTTATEKPGLKLIRRDLEHPFSAMAHIAKILKTTFHVRARNVETDFAETNGLLHIPRIVEAVDINNAYESQNSIKELVATAVGPRTKESLELQFSFARLDSLCYAPCRRSDRPLDPGEVEIHVKATGINFKDVMVALGQLSDTYIGQRFAGVVTLTGSSVDISPGTRACGIVQGSFKSFVHMHERALLWIPDSLSFTEASAMPVAFITAHYSLTYLARLRKGDSVLIHAAAGSVGQAAIQLSQQLGATIYVTIMRTTKGHGVDVVLNSLAGEALTGTWRCIAPLGRFIEIGKRDIASFAGLPMAPFSRNVSFASVDLAVVYKQSLELLAHLTSELQHMLLATPREATPPYPLQIFKRSRVEEAFRYLQTGMQSGKAVVDWEAEDIIQMASHGAKNLILLSRSGPVTPAAEELLKDLRAQGVHVQASVCDITNKAELATTIQTCQMTMPPVKGCIQGSMVVKNILLDRMSYDWFCAALTPKIQGS